MADDLKTGAADEMGDITLRAREEVIEADHLMSVIEEAFAQVRADETGAPGDEYAFGTVVGTILIHMVCPCDHFLPCCAGQSQ